MNKRIFQALVVMLIASGLTAQQDLLMHGMSDVFQKTYVNPAYRPAAGIHIGLPFMSSVSAHHQNTIFNPSRIFSEQEGQTVLDTEYFLANIKDENYFGVDVAADILSIGMPLKDHYFSFAMRERVFAQVTLPGDMLRFPFTGNGNFEETGTTLDFSGLALDLSRYTEYGIGWQWQNESGWNLGVRAKYLVGKENITTSESNMTWTTDADTYAWSFSGQMEVQTSGVDYLLDSLDGNGLLENGNFTRYIFEGQNSGLGLDLGIGKEINERLSVYASIVDLGHLSWKKGNRNYSAAGNEFSFLGIEITEAILGADSAFSDSLDTAIEELMDSLEDSFNTSEDTESYNSSLRTRLHGSVSYRLLKTETMTGTLGLVVQADVFNKIEVPSFTFMYSHSFADRMNLAASYSLADGNDSNIGLALSVKGGPIVFYAAMDNILWLQMSNVRFGERPEPNAYPSFSKNATVHFGMNLLLSKKKESKGPQPRGV